MLFAGVKVFGLQVYIVLSGSMEPEIQTGSLVYVRKVDPEQVEVKDVITYKLDEDTISTHRVVEIYEEGGYRFFRTKGDANDVVDGGAVREDSILGSPIFSIPKLGEAANYIQNPPGSYYAIAGGAVLVLFVMIIEFFTAEPKNKAEKNSKPKH